MKLATRYYLYNVRNSLLIAFGVVTGILLSSGLFLHFNRSENTEYNISGFEMTCIIFTLVTGLVAFREYFRFFQQNGISRKSQFVGWGIALAVLCLGEAAICLLAGRIFSLFLNYESMFSQIYAGEFFYPNPVFFAAQEFFWIFAICLLMGSAGFAITLLYYRLSKIGKLLVSILVPGTLFILLPMADQPLLHGGYTWLLKQIMILATGHTEKGVFLWIPITTALVCSALCLLAAWLMMRRAEIK